MTTGDELETKRLISLLVYKSHDIRIILAKAPKKVPVHFYKSLMRFLSEEVHKLCTITDRLDGLLLYDSRNRTLESRNSRSLT